MSQIDKIRLSCEKRYTQKEGQKEGVDHEETFLEMVKICLKSYLSSYRSGKWFRTLPKTNEF